MEGFDTITMSYLPTPMPLQPATGPDQHHAMPIVSMDHFDQRSAYDVDTFAGYRLPQPQHLSFAN